MILPLHQPGPKMNAPPCWFISPCISQYLKPRTVDCNTPDRKPDFTCLLSGKTQHSQSLNHEQLNILHLKSIIHVIFTNVQLISLSADQVYRKSSNRSWALNRCRASNRGQGLGLHTRWPPTGNWITCLLCRYLDMASSSDETGKKRCNEDVLIEAGPWIEAVGQLVCTNRCRGLLFEDLRYSWQQTEIYWDIFSQLEIIYFENCKVIRKLKYIEHRAKFSADVMW